VVKRPHRNQEYLLHSWTSCITATCRDRSFAPTDARMVAYGTCDPLTPCHTTRTLATADLTFLAGREGLRRMPHTSPMICSDGQILDQRDCSTGCIYSKLAHAGAANRLCRKLLVLRQTRTISIHFNRPYKVGRPRSLRGRDRRVLVENIRQIRLGLRFEAMTKISEESGGPRWLNIDCVATPGLGQGVCPGWTLLARSSSIQDAKILALLPHVAVLRRTKHHARGSTGQILQGGAPRQNPVQRYTPQSLRSAAYRDAPQHC